MRQLEDYRCGDDSQTTLTFDIYRNFFRAHRLFDIEQANGSGRVQVGSGPT
jgi:hypothetical protein